MNKKELLALLEQVETIYSKLPNDYNDYRYIKYIQFNYDTRDNTVYRISFREWFCRDMIMFEFHNAQDIIKLYNWLNKEETKC